MPNRSRAVQDMSARILTALFQFWSWWRQELIDLLPGFMSPARKNSVPNRVVSIEPGGLRLVETRGANRAPRFEGPEPIENIIDRLAAEGALAKVDEIGLRLPYKSCFVRHVELPSAAADNFERLLALDLERATPFRPKDVRSAFHVDTAKSAAPGKTAIRQLIVKRSAIDGTIGAFEQAGLRVTLLDCWDEDGTTALPINLLDADIGARGTSGARSPLLRPLAAATLALAAGAAYLAVDRHDAALDELQAGIARMKVKVQSARDAQNRSQAMIAEIDKFHRLRAAIPSKAAALEELTRLIPDTAWITDLRIDGTTVDISGLAASAVALVPTLERSTLFVDATSTAPLTFDQRQDKERFSIRVRFRSAIAESGAQVPFMPVPTLPLKAKP